MNPHDTAQDRRFRERLTRRAIATRASLLAASLHAYAQAEGMDWAGLAHSLGCTPDTLHRIALCRPPRPEHFAEDVQTIAEGLADYDRLLNLLRRLQILEAFADRAVETRPDYETSTGGMMLAARDREDADEEAGKRGDEEQKAEANSSSILHPSSLPEGEDTP